MKTSRALTLLAALPIAACSMASVEDEPSDAIETELRPVDFVNAGSPEVDLVEATVKGRAVDVFVPTGPPPPGGFGAVVFAHGFRLKRGDYDRLLAHVAAWGYVVATTDYRESLLDMDHRWTRSWTPAARSSQPRSPVFPRSPLDA
jgi:hypothetical protein